MQAKKELHPNFVGSSQLNPSCCKRQEHIWNSERNLFKNWMYNILIQISNKWMISTVHLMDLKLKHLLKFHCFQISHSLNRLVFKKQSLKGRCPRGVLVRAKVFSPKDCWFKPSTRSHNSQRKLCIVNHLVQWSIELRGQTRWVRCNDGIKLQSFCRVRFWTSLVRKLPW